jgi:hypothetical protein
MTSTLAGSSATRAGDPPPDPADLRRTVTGLDLLAGGSVLLLALTAWSALALAHLGAHSWPAVLGVTLAALAVCVLLAVRLGGPRVRLAPDLPGVAVALGCAAVMAALAVPGFSYGVADKDPGAYVAHALAISTTGSYSFVDPVLATATADPTFPVQLISPGVRFTGIWVSDAATGTIVPQFYHLWPALLGTAYDVGGMTALRVTVSLMGVLSVLALCAALRRAGDALLGGRVTASRAGGLVTASRAGGLVTASGAGGLVAAGAGGLLLATNMLQVWQTRYPTTEVISQALYLGALLGVVVALQTGWRPAAGMAGLLVGVGWLNRPDGLLLFLLSVGAGAALLATRRWDGRATWFAAGLVVVLPHALRQAYDYAGNYSFANDIPPLRTVAVVTVGVLAAGAVLRLVGRRPLTAAQRLLHGRRAQLVVGSGVVVVACGLLVLGFLRPQLFGEAFFVYLDPDNPVRSYDEQIMRRLAWFITVPGFLLMLAGLAVVALRRWSAAAWALVLPTLVLFPLYAYSARNSTRLLWWTRRYVPTVLPGIVVLIALAIAFFFVWRYRGRLWARLPAVAALGALVGVFLSQSLPLRAHDEWRGSFELTEQVAALSGDRQGVYLWEYDQGCCTNTSRLLATPVWLHHQQVSALLPSDASMAVDGNARRTVIERYTERFAGQPVFVVTDSPELPEGIDPDTVEPVLQVSTTLPMWEESDEQRPDAAREVPLDVSVWHVRGT